MAEDKEEKKTQEKQDSSEENIKEQEATAGVDAVSDSEGNDSKEVAAGGEAGGTENAEKKEESQAEEEGGMAEEGDTASKQTAPTPKPSKKKKKVRRQVQKGKAYVKSTYNNTVVTLTDLHGNSLAWSSAGLLGFKGAKKATTYAANQVVLDVAEKVQKYGLSELEIFVKGVGSGREAAIRALAQKGFTVSLIKDKTPIPHNGCRPPKPRRV